MNARMAELKRCFERAGFTNVKTLLSSGNVIFDSSSRSAPAILRKIQAAMKTDLDRTFLALLRSVADLEQIIASDPYGRFRLGPKAKRVVTFLPEPLKPIEALPIELHGAKILAAEGYEVFSAYVPGPHGPVFMTLIEKTFGSDVTTRTWDTVLKCAKA
jgi:uncharacterized protein (DUF1697 family)